MPFWLPYALAGAAIVYLLSLVYGKIKNWKASKCDRETEEDISCLDES
jgi:hypothetical protein